MDRDNGWVAQLRHATCLAQKAVQFLRPGQVAGTRHLDRDDAIQSGVACLVDRAEGAMPQRVEQLELAKLLSGGSPPASALVVGSLSTGALARLQVEGRSAPWAGDLLALGELHELDGVVAVGTEDVHGPAPEITTPIGKRGNTARDHGPRDCSCRQ